MGEYYNWVNVDKREFICPNDFDLGNKLFESRWTENTCLRALRELLSKDWAGDHVFFMGDETPIPADTNNETLKIIHGQTLEIDYPGMAYEVLIETYRNVSCLFKAAEVEVRNEILFYLEVYKSDSSTLSNEYGIDVANPFAGLFLRNGESFRFTINHSKKVYYSPENVVVCSLNNHEVWDGVDPLPFLMCYGRGLDPGDWLGDIIGVANEAPEGYSLLEEMYFDL